MRLAVANIFHLSNTFNQRPTEWQHFVCARQLAGDLIGRLQPANAALIESMIRAASEVQTTIVPIFEAVAPAGGPLTRDAVDALLREFSQTLNEQATALDALVLVLSGCMIDEDGHSVDEMLLATARRALPAERPIIAVWSNLANLRLGMVESSHLSLSYDLRDPDAAERTGGKVIDLVQTLSQAVTNPQVEFRKLPLLLPPTAWRVDRQPVTSIERLAREFEALDGVLDVSVCMGMPYADSANAGLGLLVSTATDGELASSLATRLRNAIWTDRDAFFDELVNIETAVHEAMQSTVHPVVIADAGDDPALGAPGEGTGMLWALIDLGAQNACLAPVVDAQAVEAAIAAGVGSTLTLDLGGKFDRSAGYPVEVTAQVRRIAGDAQLGRVVRLDVEGRHGGSIEVVVCEQVREANLEMFEAVGIDLTAKQIAAAKSSYRAPESFGNLAARLIETTTPGTTTPVLAFFDYQRVPRPIYPLDAF